MKIESILNAQEITELAKERFKEERATDHLEGWFLAKEIMRECDEKFKKDGNLIRPLLCVKKEEIVKYLKEAGQAWVEDASNQDDAFARSYALINPAFSVDSFTGYCDPVAVFGDIDPIGDITRERIDDLKKYNEMVCDLTREEEILRTKEIIHDRLGSTLITTRRYLENGTLSENNSKLLEMWKNNISVLNTAENDCKDENFAKDIENAAKLVGITLETVGNLPTDNNAVARVLTFATMQCLNNAARHAKADKMILESLDDGEKYIFKFANNGRKPPQKINEGGGLSSVRKKAEQIGGSMKISTSEIFVLEITIPKSEVLQYDKSADS